MSEDAVTTAAKRALAPFEGPTNGDSAENPYTLQLELQTSMNDLVGIIRKADEITEALDRLDQLRERFKHMHVEGHRQYNPGWNLAIDLRNMLLVSECVAKAALERTESRGGHTRDDHPAMDSSWRKMLLVCRGRRRRRRRSRHHRHPRGPGADAARPARRCSKLGAGEVLHRQKSWPTTQDGEADEPTTRTLRVWRGDDAGGALQDFTVEVNEGEVVLDIIHRLQQTQTADLAVRWNCKAGKCGSCSAEINGKPRLMCMTRMSTFADDEVVTVTPLRTFPVIRDLVTDVSFNYEKAREIPSFTPPKDLQPGEYRMEQEDVERSQEFRKCIECFLCQNVCHVVRDHEENKKTFAGPRYPDAHRRARDASRWTPWTGARSGAGRARSGLLQHHQVLHRGLPRKHQDHRQRADPDEGARRRPQVRPGGVAGQQAVPARVTSRNRQALREALSSPLSRVVFIERPINDERQQYEHARAS